MHIAMYCPLLAEQHYSSLNTHGIDPAEEEAICSEGRVKVCKLWKFDIRGIAER